MNHQDCVLSFAAAWLAAKSAAEGDDFAGYDRAAGRALDEAEAAWVELNVALARRDAGAVDDGPDDGEVPAVAAPAEVPRPMIWREYKERYRPVPCGYAVRVSAPDGPWFAAQQGGFTADHDLALYFHDDDLARDFVATMPGDLGWSVEVIEHPLNVNGVPS